MDQAKISEYELARRSGIPQPMINKILNGKNTNPKISTLKPLADYFMVTLSQLLGEVELSTVSTLMPINEYHHGIKEIPLKQWENLKGQKNDKPETMILTESDVSDNGFAVKIQDNSMSPKFRLGSIIIIDPNVEAKHKDYVLVSMGTDKHTSLRQIIFENDHFFLKCINPSNPIDKKVLLEKNDAIIGVMIESRNFYRTN